MKAAFQFSKENPGHAGISDSGRRQRPRAATRFRPVGYHGAFDFDEVAATTAGVLGNEAALTDTAPSGDRCHRERVGCKLL